MKKRTKILATVGPASQSVEVLESMIRAGVNVFRLNFSHGDHDYHSQTLGNIRQAMQRTGLMVGVLQDISGPKIRVGSLSEDFNLQPEDRLEFVREEIRGEAVGEGRYRVSINRPEILDRLSENDSIYLCDGTIRLRVLEAGERVVTEVQNGGKLSSRKGVNFPSTELGIDVLTPKDRDDLLWGIRNEVDFMAISFVQNADDMRRARELVRSHGGHQQLFAKIEKFDAVQNIDTILQESDGLMVARGDLGIEVPYYRVPSIQKTLIRKANEAGKPVITATQMLLSMTEKERATRAEISDVANAVLDGTDAVMLSEESAVGRNPVLAVETMMQTIRETEKIYPYGKFGVFAHHDEMDMINESIVRLGNDLKAKGILALTTSGQSAKKLARYRPAKTIYAVTHTDRTARALTIVWGVVPAFMVERRDLAHAVAQAIQEGVRRGVIDRQGIYILTAGDPVGVAGTTNNVRILREHEIDYFQRFTLKPAPKRRAEAETEPTLF